MKIDWGDSVFLVVAGALIFLAVAALVAGKGEIALLAGAPGIILFLRVLTDSAKDKDPV